MNVAVFCGSSPGVDPAHVEAARGHRPGLMGALADAALAAGAEAVGVIPRFLSSAEVAHSGLTELAVVESMHERQARISEIADGFVVLGGGFGTLDELFEILSWKQLGLHDRPIVVVNVAGAWDGLGRLAQDLLANGFVRRSHLELFALVASAQAALDALERAPLVTGSVAAKLP